jgi:hypothetical protein
VVCWRGIMSGGGKGAGRFNTVPSARTGSDPFWVGLFSFHFTVAPPPLRVRTKMIHKTIREHRRLKLGVLNTVKCTVPPTDDPGSRHTTLPLEIAVICCHLLPFQNLFHLSAPTAIRSVLFRYAGREQPTPPTPSECLEDSRVRSVASIVIYYYSSGLLNTPPT